MATRFTPLLLTQRLARYPISIFIQVFHAAPAQIEPRFLTERHLTAMRFVGADESGVGQLWLRYVLVRLMAARAGVGHRVPGVSSPTVVEPLQLVSPVPYVGH